MMSPLNSPYLTSQADKIHALLATLPNLKLQSAIEEKLTETFTAAPPQIIGEANDYYTVLNDQLYRYILKCYQNGETKIGMWRYVKNLSKDQLNYQPGNDAQLDMLDALLRIYFCSDPLDDLTCLFTPINDNQLIKRYLQWIKTYFYDQDYPTSLLWLYALDSSIASFFPDEIIYLGQCLEHDDPNILLPDFDYTDTVLLKRYSSEPTHFVKLEGVQANNEFRPISAFLQREYRDRCLSRSIKRDNHDEQDITWEHGWEKFEDVLRFGVSDKNESGCISFSDLRSSTEFLNTHGKSVYLNKIQQPFFEQTQIISQYYNGRIDKFMGDNVMCVFLNDNMPGETEDERAQEAILNNFLALFALCKVLYGILIKHGLENSNLGLRSGVAYGHQILRSNLGNEIVRDFTVTGEKVNLAARLEHIGVSELITHNRAYFAKAMERFPQITHLIPISGDSAEFDPEIKQQVDEYLLSQNILANLEQVAQAKFDIRFNEELYVQLRAHLLKKGYRWLNAKTALISGYETFQVGEFELRFFMFYYNPKGFADYQTIWLLPIDTRLLQDLDMALLR